jgi:hypothetical protein
MSESLSTPPMTPPPPYKLCTCILYNVLIHTGKWERTEPERRLEEQQFTKLGRKYQHDCIFSLKTKDLPQSLITIQLF